MKSPPASRLGRSGLTDQPHLGMATEGGKGSFALVPVNGGRAQKADMGLGLPCCRCRPCADFTFVATTPWAEPIHGKVSHPFNARALPARRMNSAPCRQRGSL